MGSENYRGSIRVIPAKKSSRIAYEHQIETMKNLDVINKEPSFSTMIVIPTGGGKTYTATEWLLKNAVDRRIKVLWIAHRQMLLDQAADSFASNAASDVMPYTPEFTIRIVSGAARHARMIDIRPEDEVLIASKDSIGRSVGDGKLMKSFDAWLKGQDTIFFVIDEAHHAIAKTYRNVIAYVKKKVPHVKLIGLTATPFRTADSEKGLLAKIFTDGVKNGQVTHTGITYSVDAQTLIKKQILSTPEPVNCKTDEKFDVIPGSKEWDQIEHLDTLPERIQNTMIRSANRNRLIVDQYVKNKDKYGQTIVFAINVDHAIALNALFNDAGVKAGYVVSSIRDAYTGALISPEENDRVIDAYRKKEIQVLISVNILTEGFDVPMTQTVFLTRPTISRTLMTQMVGRALRGERAGGTRIAYLVYFIDDWQNSMLFVTPDSLLLGENEFQDNPRTKREHEIRLISIEKIEEFARILDDNVDTRAIEAIPFMERVPVGMYMFDYTVRNGEEGDSLDHNCEVMVYDRTKQSFEKLMQGLPELFKEEGVDREEYLTDENLSSMEEKCHQRYFEDTDFPPYHAEDIRDILRYYAQKSAAPAFYSFDDIGREKLDVAKIAQQIVDQGLGGKAQRAYLENIWNSADANVLHLFFGSFYVFRKLVASEADQIVYPEDRKAVLIYEKKKEEDMQMYELEAANPEKYARLREAVFEKARTKDGKYRCAECGKESADRGRFQIDHIRPLGRGGKTVLENLQLLCGPCNMRKSDHEENER